MVNMKLHWCIGCLSPNHPHRRNKRTLGVVDIKNFQSSCTPFQGASPKSSSMEALLENKHSSAQCPQCLISNCLDSAVLSFPILSQIIVELFCGHGCSSTPRLLPAHWTHLSSSSACLSRSDWLHPHPVQSGDLFLLPSSILHFVQRHEFASISK